MENLIELPIGAVDKVHINCDMNTHFGYSSDTDVIGQVYDGEEYFVYKKVDGWFLIGNHQWIDTSLNIKPEVIEQLQEEILQQEVIVAPVEEIIEKPVETIEEVVIEKKHQGEIWGLLKWSDVVFITDEKNQLVRALAPDV